MLCIFFFFFFFNDTATTEIYTLSLHDALPIWARIYLVVMPLSAHWLRASSVKPSSPQAFKSGMSRLSLRVSGTGVSADTSMRSEEHTSELQSRQYLVCRLLLEKKKKNNELKCD